MAQTAREYQVVARRFRPRLFSEVVGQDAILRSLKSAITAERIPHAFLFTGSRGVGKTTLARILARALNCERGPTADPCEKCHSCKTILDGSNPDVVEIDAASHNLVDDIRELRERVGFASMGSRYKVYILDEAHMLTRSAFNAFLKTLEEPPRGVVFVLATTEAHKVPETIRSRCQIMPFRRIGQDDIRCRLAMICRREGQELPDEVLAEIAAGSRGGMRDAETTLERVLPVAREQAGAFDLEAYRRLVHRVGTDRATEVLASLLQGEAGPALHFAAELVEIGVDEREALGELLDVLRNLLLLVVDGPDSDLVAGTGESRERLLGLAEGADAARLDAMIQAALLGRERIRRLDDRRLVLEVTLLRMARAGELPSLAELAAELRGAAPEGSPGVGAPAGESGDLRGRLLQRLREVKPMLQHTIELCRLEGPDADGVVRLGLHSERRMHGDRLASAEVQEDLRKMLVDLLGRDVTLQVELPAAPAAAKADAPSPRPTGRAARVAERFDGEILESDDRSSP